MFDWTKLTNTLIDGHQLLAQLLETAKLSDILLGLAQSGGAGESLRDSFASHPSSEPELRIMPRVVGFGAMASLFATAPDNSSNRAGPKIGQSAEPLQDLESFSLQNSERIGHKRPPLILNVYIRSEL